ncbi:hypothetical protein IPP75_04010 [Candidatus Saccharibacteria bacterium]|nr:MAG: hypothetical protein IPP75_04010 [Candidatus Saccharibacteria bacterium]
MRGFVRAPRLPFLVAKKEAKKARHISDLSAAVVTDYNAKTLLRRIFAAVVASHNSWTGMSP